MLVPNVCQCFVIEAMIVSQESDQFETVEKLLLTVQTEDGSRYTYRTGLNSWTASSLLACFRRMSRAQISEKVEIALTPKSRTVFAAVATLEPDGTRFKRVELDPDDLGRKLSYDELLDAVSYINGTDDVSTLDQLRQSSTDADSFMEVEPAPTAAETDVQPDVAKVDHAPISPSAVASRFTARRKQLSRTSRAKTKAAG